MHGAAKSRSLVDPVPLPVGTRSGKLAGMDRPPKPPMDAAALERAGLHYLGRFSSGIEHFRRVLERKVRRRNPGFAPPDAGQQAMIEALVAKCRRLGLLDDAAFARTKAAAMAARGKPARTVAARLAAQGVDEAAIAGALDALAEDAGGRAVADLAAACRFARRRRLGPWRTVALDDARRKREIAAFARAGHAFGVARAIVEAADETDIAALGADMQRLEGEVP